jgi:hypothetical protein
MGYIGPMKRVRIAFNPDFARDPSTVGSANYVANYVRTISGVSVTLVPERAREEYRSQPMASRTAERLLETLAETSLHARSVRVRA